MATPPVPTRLTGRTLMLTLGAVDYVANATSWLLTSEDADNDATTFYDAAQGGGRDWKL